MKFQHIFNNIYDEEIGYKLSTGNLKPAHIANGFAKSVLNKTFDTKSIQHVIRDWAKYRDPVYGSYGPYPDRDYNTLVNDVNHSNHLPQFEDYKDDYENEFSNLRKAIFSIINADDAFYAFKGSKLLSASYSSEFLITSDQTDQGLGSFLANLFSNTDLKKIFINKMTNNKNYDPISTLLLPLIGKSKEFDSKNFNKVLNKEHQKEFLSMISKLSENLCSYENSNNHLRTIKRFIHFVCMTPFFHIQSLSADGILNKRHPVLLTTDINNDSEISLLSNQSIDNIYNRFNDWLINKLELKLKNGEYLDIAEKDNKPLIKCPNDNLTDEKIMEWINNENNFEYPSANNKVKFKNQRINLFKRRCKIMENDNIHHILATTLHDIFNIESKYSPKTFINKLSKRLGLFYPNYKETDYTRMYVNSSIRDLLVKLNLKKDEIIPLPIFLHRLWNNLGIIIGGDNDHSLLNSFGLNIEPKILKMNKDKFVDDLVNMGLARKYADNETLIGENIV